MAEKRDRRPDGPFTGMFLTTTLIVGLSLATAYLTGMIETLQFGTILLSLQSVFYLVFGIAFGFFTHVFIHEFGHLLTGLASGYSFVSFRMGPMMFTMKDGKLKQSWHFIPGTMGQCLMAPPAPRDGQYPYALYNLGGGLANLLTALVLLALMIISPWPDIVRPLGFGFITVGLYLGVSNLVPASLQGIRNDGANVRSLKANPITRQAFWAILQVSAHLVAGKRLRDLSSGLFAIQAEVDKTDAIICNWAAIKASYHEDWHDFETAKHLATEWYEAEGMPEVLRYELLGMLVFYELIGPCRPEELKRLYTAQLARHSLSYQYSLGRPRRDYAFELLFNNDTAAAQRCLEQFEQLAIRYPYQGEVESERELIALVDEIVIQRAEAAHRRAEGDGQQGEAGVEAEADVEAETTTAGQQPDSADKQADVADKQADER